VPPIRRGKLNNCKIYGFTRIYKAILDGSKTTVKKHNLTEPDALSWLDLYRFKSWPFL